jgi:hypothetical protein
LYGVFALRGENTIQGVKIREVRKSCFFYTGLRKKNCGRDLACFSATVCEYQSLPVVYYTDKINIAASTTIASIVPTYLERMTCIDINQCCGA